MHGKSVLLGNFLRAEMLLDRQRIIGAALHRRVVADDHHLAARDAADARDQARAGDFAFVQVERRELADLEKRRAGIEQPLDAVARKQFAAADVALAMLVGPALRGRGDIGTQCLGERAIVRGARPGLIAAQVDTGLQPRCAHGAKA